jgi:hypothetical protein
MRKITIIISHKSLTYMIPKGTKDYCPHDDKQSHDAALGHGRYPRDAKDQSIDPHASDADPKQDHNHNRRDETPEHQQIAEVTLAAATAPNRPFGPWCFFLIDLVNFVFRSALAAALGPVPARLVEQRPKACWPHHWPRTAP